MNTGIRNPRPAHPTGGSHGGALSTGTGQKGFACCSCESEPFVQEPKDSDRVKVGVI